MMLDTDERMIYRKFHIHPASREVYMDGQEIELTRVEFDVLFWH